ncbi:MAG: GFA family protein [Burkholderiales bacterium]
MANRQSRGSCLCGAVEFLARLPSKWVAHCHCSRCRRAHGAAFVTWVGFESAAVELSDRDASLRWHVAEAGGSRGFCGRCGSPMFFKSDRWPGELHVARALFLEPIDREPQAHVYYETHVDWVAVDDRLPKRASQSPG